MLSHVSVYHFGIVTSHGSFLLAGIAYRACRRRLSQSECFFLKFIAVIYNKFVYVASDFWVSLWYVHMNCLGVVILLLAGIAKRACWGRHSWLECLFSTVPLAFTILSCLAFPNLYSFGKLWDAWGCL